MFEIKKAQPKSGAATCPRCDRAIFRAPSKKNPDRTVTVDSRTGPYVLEEQDDGTVVAVWTSPCAGYAYHYNGDRACATDEEVEEANDI